MFRGTFAVINKLAITENVRRIHGQLRSGTKLLVAVKANGYGHGMEQAAEAALAGGADALGVASLEEGLRLREHGISDPLLVFGRVPVQGLPLAALNHISVTLTSDWRQEDVPHLERPLNVHLKLDTGMSRLGYTDPVAAAELAEWIQSRSDMRLVGVYSHLACADADDETHLQGQVARFERALQILEERGVRPPIAHLANSAGTLRSQDLHYDMVRVGVSAYGYPPSPQFPVPVHLQPALSLYGSIQRLETIDVGETVGYGATFTATRRTRVATVPVGYADGYLRALSNRSNVWIRGQLAPVIGNVCMDQLMVDVTDVSFVETGDVVTLYGQPAPPEWNEPDFPRFDEEKNVQFVEDTFAKTAWSPPVVSLDTLAELIGTISYELMCALSHRVPKIYFDG